MRSTRADTWDAKIVGDINGEVCRRSRVQIRQKRDHGRVEVSRASASHHN